MSRMWQNKVASLGAEADDFRRRSPVLEQLERVTRFRNLPPGDLLDPEIQSVAPLFQGQDGGFRGWNFVCGGSLQ